MWMNNEKLKLEYGWYLQCLTLIPTYHNAYAMYRTYKDNASRAVDNGLMSVEIVRFPPMHARSLILERETSSDDGRRNEYLQ